MRLADKEWRYGTVETPTSIRNDAPALGQHTDEVLGGVLGSSAPDLSALRANNVIK